MAQKIPKVEVLPIEQGAIPDQNNINKHTQRGGGLLENSLRKRGAFRSIASAGKGTETPVVYAGNYTLEKAIDAGFTEIVNVHVTGNQIVNVVRDDIEPGTAQAIALGIEDNEIGKVSYAPDLDLVAQLAAQDSGLLVELRNQDKIFNSVIEGMQPIEFTPEVLNGFGALVDRELSNDSSVTLVFPKEDAERVRQQIKIDSAPIFARRVLSLVGG